MGRMYVVAASLAAGLLLNGCNAPQNDPDLQRELSGQLKDPSSVQYQHVVENPQVICGELNAKNGFGAYEGFEAFVYDRQRQKLWLESSARLSNGGYDQFHSALDRCDNHIDLFIAVSGRTNARIDARFREHS